LLYAVGIFNVDGDSWRSKRKVASHMFSQKVIDVAIGSVVSAIRQPRSQDTLSDRGHS